MLYWRGVIYILGTNLDIKDAKDEIKSRRFLAAVSGVKRLTGSRNKVVILSHRGRPDGRDMNFSLRRFTKLFEQKLKKKVYFLENADLAKAKRKIAAAGDGAIFLLENVRFLKGDAENDPKLASQLAGLGDVFISDDFATAHRARASNAGITKFITSRMGGNMRKEVAHLRRAMDRPRHPFILILGGAKMADKMGVIRNLISKIDNILVGGGVANTFLKASGADVDGSLYEKSMVASARKLLKNRKIIRPIDYRKSDGKILDIGPKTTDLYVNKILKAKTVIWGGPLGYFENKKFAKGSYAIARAIAKSKSFSIIGGGETAEIITILKLKKGIDLVSTGGGAMLDFLAGEKMPAIDALKK